MFVGWETQEVALIIKRKNNNLIIAYTFNVKKITKIRNKHSPIHLVNRHIAIL